MVDGIESNDGGVEPDVRLGELSSYQEVLSIEDLLEPVEGVEERNNGLLVRSLSGCESALVLKKGERGISSALMRILGGRD